MSSDEDKTEQLEKIVKDIFSLDKDADASIYAVLLELARDKKNADIARVTIDKFVKKYSFSGDVGHVYLSEFFYQDNETTIYPGDVLFMLKPDKLKTDDLVYVKYINKEDMALTTFIAKYISASGDRIEASMVGGHEAKFGRFMVDGNIIEIIPLIEKKAQDMLEKLELKPKKEYFLKQLNRLLEKDYAEEFKGIAEGAKERIKIFEQL